jgi:hypothetical protein
MTTERAIRSWHSRLLRFAAAAGGVLALWFCVLAGVTAAFEPEDTVLVFGPEPSLFRALASSESLLFSNGSGFIRVRGRSPGFVPRLYAGGAWLVLPGTAFGCGAAAVGTPQVARKL